MAGSPIRRKKVGKETITQNLKTGRITRSHRSGNVTISNSIGGNESQKTRVTRTIKHGPNVHSRSTLWSYRAEKKKPGRKKTSSGWGWLFGSSKKKSKPDAKKKSPAPVATTKEIKAVEVPQILLFSESTDLILKRLDSTIASFMKNDKLSRADAVAQVKKELGDTMAELMKSSIAKYEEAYSAYDKEQEEIAKKKKESEDSGIGALIVLIIIGYIFYKMVS